MKRILKFLIAGLVLVIGALPARAQLGEIQNVLTASLGAESVAVTQRVSAVSSPNLLFQCTLTGTGADVTNDLTFTLQKSVDAVSWASGATLTFTPTGTTPSVGQTNLVTSGYPYWRLITADNSGNATNCTAVLTATKDKSSLVNLDSVKVGGSTYTATAAAAATQAQVVKAAATQAALTQVVKPAATQAALTLHTMVITNAHADVTNVVTVVTNATINTVWGFATTTPQVIETNTINTVFGFATTTPQVVTTNTLTAVTVPKLTQ